MKILVLLFVTMLGVVVHAGCPDVSGKFGGFCIQESSCRPSSEVYYGFEISQNGCDKVDLRRLLPTQKITSRIYPIGSANSRGRSNLHTVMSYTDSGLKIATGGKYTNVSSVADLRKVVDTQGVATLHIRTKVGSPYCEFTTSCVLNDISEASPTP